MLRQFHFIIVGISLAAICGWVHAQDAATKPATTQPATIQTVWHLTDYLVGTADQIRDKLAHEVQRQAELRTKAKSEMDRLAVQVASAQKTAQVKLAQNADFLSLSESVKQAQAALDQARGSGTPDQRLAASSNYLALKQKLEKLQHDALFGAPDIAALQNDLQQQTRNFESAAVSIGRAEAWRRELLGALDNARMLMWPMSEKSVGVLRRVVPQKIVGKDSFEAIYTCKEIVHRGDIHEDIVTVDFKDHPVLVLVSGIDTSSMQVGKPVQLDTDAFQVIGTKLDPQLGEVRILSYAPGELDSMLKTIHKLDVGISKSDLDEFVKLAQRSKPDAKQWSGVVQLLAAFPREAPAKPGAAWTPAELNKVNELLRTQVPGDTMQVTFIARTANFQDDGTVSFVGTVQTPDGNVHDIVVNCPESYKDRAPHIKEGVRIQAKGLISKATLRDDGTLYIELSDGSF